MKTDLHIHTNCSDGSLSPEQIVERACGAGLDAIAVTDHDNANGVERAVLAARGKPLKVVAGIELSAYDRDMETHVLGLGIDYAGDRFKESMSRIQALRHERNRLLLQRLAELNIFVSFDELEKAFPFEVHGRSHIARIMVEKGYAADFKSAFSEYLAPEGKAYVKSRRLSVEQAIELCHRYGGKAVLAHPAKLRMNATQAEGFVAYLKRVGLDGIEADYFAHTNVERDFFRYLADKYGLFVTGGSDFHNADYGVNLGDKFFLPDEKTLAALGL